MRTADIIMAAKIRSPTRAYRKSIEFFKTTKNTTANKMMVAISLKSLK
jgi:hypothetical protein